MEQNKNNTYYYNVPAGVTPANHDIEYDYHVPVMCSEGDYIAATARLEISNPKTAADYLEDISGHYVEGVKDWYEAHDYLIDLAQATMVELVRGANSWCEAKEYTVVINESYAGDDYIDYCVDYHPEEGEVYISISGVSDYLKDKVASREALDQMINISADELAKL